MKIVVLSMLVVSFLMADFVKVDAGVSDSVKKLVWQDNESVEVKELRYTEAKAYCEGLTLAKQDNWRLPTVYELQSTVDLNRYDPALQRGFHFGLSENYWSSTPYADEKDRAWFINFKSGSIEHSRHSYAFYVRCVRDK